MRTSVLNGRCRRMIRVSITAAAVYALAFALPAYAQQQHAVVVADDTFQPATVQVEVGDRVVWTQEGSNPHSVTSDSGQEESFDSHPACPGSCMGEGDTFEHTFTNEGEFGYYCKIHGGEGGQGMAGTVVVQAAQQEPEPTPAPAQPTPVPAPGAPPDEAAPLPQTGGGWGIGVLVVAGLFVLGRRLLARGWSR